MKFLELAKVVTSLCKEYHNISITDIDLVTEKTLATFIDEDEELGSLGEMDVYERYMYNDTTLIKNIPNVKAYEFYGRDNNYGDISGLIITSNDDVVCYSCSSD